MNETAKTPSSKRQYPPLYEKLVPVAIAILALVVLGLLVFTVGAALGAFSS